MALRITFRREAEKAFYALPHEAYLSACGQLAAAAQLLTAAQRNLPGEINARGYRVSYCFDPETGGLKVLDVFRP